LQRAVSLVGGNRSSCPNTDIRKERGVCAEGAAHVRMTEKSWSGKRRLGVPRLGRINRRCAMSPLDVADNKVADPHDGTVAYVPPLERTAGQPEPIAAHGGLSYMAFDRDGDAGTAKALEDALAEIASGESERLTDMIDKAPPGPIKTKWGLGFRDYDECLNYIRQSNSI